MNKQEQIEAKTVRPFEVGDYVVIRTHIRDTKVEGKGKKAKTVEFLKEIRIHGYLRGIKQTEEHGTVFGINTLSMSVPLELQIVRYHDNLNWVSAGIVYPTFGECGANPFIGERVRIDFRSSRITSELLKAFYGKRYDNFNEPHYTTYTSSEPSEAKYQGLTYGGVNFNPYIIDANGEKVYYQRGLVWTLEQKQLLISSIYNGIEIGKFIFKKISWDNMLIHMVATGHGYFYDCVDGKQRFHAFLEFVQNKFPDASGNYWDDLSANAQNRFLEYDAMAVGELEEKATDKQVKAAFLTLNFTGTPMSEDHIKYVQSIQL